ncbi:MAG TPA: ATP-binding protein, partial [Roseiflexaceae bacterium]|nr:ATP-binding protein [Roseiflexaceae bacterium]
REAIGHDDAAASQALGHVRTAASQALRELRALVRLLRNPETHQADQSGISLAHLATLIENARGSGLNVELDLRGTLDHLPATVDSAAYRIVQESLTNVIRHAHATAVLIVITLDEGTLQIDIRDNGTASAARLIAGNGIAGMRERARLLGGSLSVQHGERGGVQVHASLPIGGNE